MFWILILTVFFTVWNYHLFPKTLISPARPPFHLLFLEYLPGATALRRGASAGSHDAHPVPGSLPQTVLWSLNSACCAFHLHCSVVLASCSCLLPSFVNFGPIEQYCVLQNFYSLGFVESFFSNFYFLSFVSSLLCMFLHLLLNDSVCLSTGLNLNILLTPLLDFLFCVSSFKSHRDITLYFLGIQIFPVHILKTFQV